MKVLAILLLVAAASAQINPSPFIAQIVRRTGTGEAVQNEFRALGVVVHPRHVVTVATAVHEIPRTELRVLLQTTTRLEARDDRPVEVDPFIHENFNAVTLANNIAILRVPYSTADNVQVTPRNLGALTNVECRVFMFPGGNTNLATRSLTVRNTECLNNFPFCANHELPNDVSGCSGVIGSPVICANDAYVAGITNREMVCNNLEPPLNAHISFISIEPYRQWIDNISGAKMNAKISVILILLGVVMSKLLM